MPCHPTRPSPSDQMNHALWGWVLVDSITHPALSATIRHHSLHDSWYMDYLGLSIFEELLTTRIQQEANASTVILQLSQPPQWLTIQRRRLTRTFNTCSSLFCHQGWSSEQEDGKANTGLAFQCAETVSLLLLVVVPRVTPWKIPSAGSGKLWVFKSS